MATDLTSRGLDIKGFDTVVNYDMPGQLAQAKRPVSSIENSLIHPRHNQYIGPLFRDAGSSHWCESDRKMLKAAIKHASNVDKVRHRTLPPEKVAQWAAKLGKLNDDVAAILKEEKEEQAIRQAEIELTY